MYDLGIRYHVDAFRSESFSIETRGWQGMEAKTRSIRYIGVRHWCISIYRKFRYEISKLGIVVLQYIGSLGTMYRSSVCPYFDISDVLERYIAASRYIGSSDTKVVIAICRCIGRYALSKFDIVVLDISKHSLPYLTLLRVVQYTCYYVRRYLEKRALWKPEPEIYRKVRNSQAVILLSHV